MRQYQFTLFSVWDVFFCHRVNLGTKAGDPKGDFGNQELLRSYCTLPILPILIYTLNKLLAFVKRQQRWRLIEHPEAKGHADNRTRE